MLRHLIPTLVSIGLFIGTSLGTIINGTVTDSAATTPVNKAIVQLRSGNRLLGTDTTDVQGAYSITVPDTTGKCTLRAIQIGTYYTKSIDTTLSSAPLTINIALSKIIVAAISGVVKDSTAGTPLTGAVVSLGFGVNARRDTTGADGAFSFDSVRSGTQTLSVSMINYTSKSVQLTVGSAVITADVALVGIAYGSVSGVVSDTSTGLPIKGAIVRIGNSKTQIDTTGADGAYTIINVKTGTQTVKASASKYAMKSSQVTVVAKTAAAVNFALVPIISGTGSVSGVVTDSAKATPLAGAIVRIGIGINARIDTTGADGVYSLSDVKIGNQTISVTCPKYVSKSIPIAVAGTTPVKQNIALVALLVTSVSGIVTDRAKSTPLANVVVRIYNNGTNKYDTTGADGKYQFAEVSTGSVIMIVSATGFAALRDTFTISGTNPVSHNIALSGKTAVNLQHLSKGSKTPLIVQSGDKFAVTNISGAGKLTIFSLNGKCVYKTALDKNCASITIPSSISSSGLSLIAQITIEGKNWTQQILSAK